MEELIIEILKYKKLFESFSMVSIFIMDTKRRYVYMNEAFFRSTNSSGFPLYQTPEEVFTQARSQMKKIKEEDEAIISGDIKYADRNFNSINPAGERACYRVFKAPLKYNSGIIGIIGMGVDVTEETVSNDIFIFKAVKTLSPQERMYLFFMARGKIRKQIAREMKITEEHGDKIKSEIFRKLDLRGKAHEIPYLVKAYCKALRNIE